MLATLRLCAVKPGQLWFTLRKFLVISLAISKLASDWGGDANVHSNVDPSLLASSLNKHRKGPTPHQNQNVALVEMCWFVWFFLVISPGGERKSGLLKSSNAAYQSLPFDLRSWHRPGHGGYAQVREIQDCTFSAELGCGPGVASQDTRLQAVSSNFSVLAKGSTADPLRCPLRRSLRCPLRRP